MLRTTQQVRVRAPLSRRKPRRRAGQIIVRILITVMIVAAAEINFSRALGNNNNNKPEKRVRWRQVYLAGDGEKRL